MDTASSDRQSVSLLPLRSPLLLAVTIALGMCASPFPARAASTTFKAGAPLGMVRIAALDEASGIAASRRNPGVLWTHNDGSGGEVYALGINGAHLATFYSNANVTDTEDIAVGPGPIDGASYLYVGDIGGNHGRRQVKILRIPEPFVNPAWRNPPSASFSGVNTFTLSYPDGEYDAESLMVDPLSGDLFVITKQNTGARVYRANLTRVPNGGMVVMGLVRVLPFAQASGADISPDGSLIVLRREDLAWAWNRNADESVASALSRAGRRIPVVGPPFEPNGEGIAVLANGKGYVTISEGKNPVIYFFKALVPKPPEFTVPLKDKTAYVGRSITFGVRAKGYPLPLYQWSFSGNILAGKKSHALILRRLSPEDAGEYTVTATNRYGSATSSATLAVTAR